MKRIVFFCFYMFLLLQFASATHNRAGEITYRHLSGHTYEITIITYTRINSPADRPELPVSWGDGNKDTLPRIEEVVVSTDIKRNKYIGTHTYPGPATYIISFEDPNRNAGVNNIPNSVSVPFYIETKLVINPFFPNNSSPVLLQPPIDLGCVNRLFIHNPNAYDPDGDSLSYKLTVCRGTGGNPIPGYAFPTASIAFTLDPITGDLIWNNPLLQGEYNVAILIEEWRSGFNIGSVMRDMQINIVACSNNPPVIDSIADICVVAGQQVLFNVTATDPDNEQVKISATGAPLVHAVSPASFPSTTGLGTVTAPFSWNTACAHVRKQPYQVLFKAEDKNSQVVLVDFKRVNITVIGPPPQNLVAGPSGTTINLSWDPSICTNAIGYKIYRKKGFFGFVPGPCETGVPSYTGYSQISTLFGVQNTSYTDSDNGNGLVQGIEYCYMIVAFFPDSAESKASDEICTRLKKDLPVITNVSVTKTGVSNGEMYVAWSKPVEFDTIQNTGPYRYVLSRSTGFSGANLLALATFNDLNDTVYNDIALNTLDEPYSYQIEFFNDTPGNSFSVGKSKTASSVYLTLSPSDNLILLNWKEQVPWLNSFDVTTPYIVYRFNTVSMVFDSIGFSPTNTYTDSGLANGVQYCYYVKSLGLYSAPGFVRPIINFSQETCAIPVDNVLPCNPNLTVTTDCISENTLTWNNPNLTCADDVLQYNIYYSSVLNGNLELIISISSPGTVTFNHGGLTSVAGCYLITAVDSSGNESIGANRFCVENCPVYELPNIFTPNQSGQNDLFHPFPYRFVKDIDLTIWNRWGQVVFTSTNPDINWNGTHKESGKELSDGVYFYVCHVNEIFLSGIKTRTLKGIVHLIR